MATTRNPQDATLRNVRAAKAQIAKLERRLSTLEAIVHHLATIVDPEADYRLLGHLRGDKGDI